MAQSILVVDDDEELSNLITEVLAPQGYEVRAAPSLFRARGLVTKHPPDLVILDRQLPDGDGLLLCAELKAEDRTKGIPVLFLSAAKKSPAERAKGLDKGGDDYLVKPFSPEELLARVRAVLRRAWGPPPVKVVLESGPLRLDGDAHKVTLHGKELALTPKEYYLLKTFLENPDKALTRQSLLQLVWGPGKSEDRTPKAVDVAVSNLKAKLGDASERIKTVRGEGFLFESRSR